jgi:hypothetical protein
MSINEECRFELSLQPCFVPTHPICTVQKKVKKDNAAVVPSFLKEIETTIKEYSKGNHYDAVSDQGLLTVHKDKIFLLKP